jgi:hypothetical protein
MHGGNAKGEASMSEKDKPIVFETNVRYATFRDHHEHVWVYHDVPWPGGTKVRVTIEKA